MSDSLQPYRLYPPGSSVHGILQARILEWVVTSSSRGSCQPRDRSPGLLCLLRWQAGSLSRAPPGKPRFISWTGNKSLRLPRLHIVPSDLRWTRVKFPELLALRRGCQVSSQGNERLPDRMFYVLDQDRPAHKEHTKEQSFLRQALGVPSPV